MVLVTLCEADAEPEPEPLPESELLEAVEVGACAAVLDAEDD